MIGQVRPPFLLILEALGACLLHTKVSLQGVPVLPHLDQALHNGFIAHLGLMVLTELCLRQAQHSIQYPKNVRVLCLHNQALTMAALASSATWC